MTESRLSSFSHQSFHDATTVWLSRTVFYTHLPLNPLLRRMLTQQKCVSTPESGRNEAQIYKMRRRGGQFFRIFAQRQRTLRMARRKPIKKRPPESVHGDTRKQATRSANRPKRQLPAWVVGIRSFVCDERTRFIVGLFVLLAVFYVLLSFLSYFFTGAADQSKLGLPWEQLKAMRTEIQNWASVTGAQVAETCINHWFGLPSFALVGFFALVGLRLVRAVSVSLRKSFFHCFFWLVWGSVFLGFALSPVVDKVLFFTPGGEHGKAVSSWITSYVGVPGAALLLLGVLVLYCVVSFRSALPFIKRLFRRRNKKTRQRAGINTGGTTDDAVAVGTEIVPEEWVEQPAGDTSSTINLEIDTPAAASSDESEETTDDFTFDVDRGDMPVQAQQPADNDEHTDLVIDTPQDTETGDPALSLQKMGKYDPTLDLSRYQFPTLDLLKTYPNENAPIIDMDEQNANKDKIVSTLRNYGIEITSIKATIGPTITLYEIVPRSGIRISKIRNLESDIMLSLAAKGIRIIAPIPGKGTIGIEVPNERPQIVSMHSVVASKKFQEESKYVLPVALGRTITNEVFMFDLAKAPHLLVAGATGQGKSVGLNAIITSLLYKKHPSQLKFVLVDPKMVEFNIYAALEKHYMATMPDADSVIITDSTRVIQTLNSLVVEMEDRYTLLMAAHCRNIAEYNEKFVNCELNKEEGHRYLPYIVIVIDEFGDLIMVAGKEIEMPIARITQKARAVGMHMILATQRPSVNIITGVIKANVPGRVAFRVASQIDSRTILDAPGANQLVGKGDLLYSSGGDLVRVQCAFVDTPEVEDIVNHISRQQAYPSAYELPEYVPEGDGAKTPASDIGKRDPKFEEIARWVVAQQQGSTSAIQRTFGIGYNRAGRISDQLEAAGIVSANNGSKGRQVLIMDEYSLEKLLETL